MNIGAGVKAILRFCLSNMKSRNVGITDGRYLWITAEMGKGAMMYIPSFIQIGSGIHNLMGRRHDREESDPISLLLSSSK
jgi:hypothetical protein